MYPLLTVQYKIQWLSYTSGSVLWGKYLKKSLKNQWFRAWHYRKEIEFVKLLTDFLYEYDIKYIKQFQYKNYRIDLYLPELLIAVEYDEDNHKYYSDDMEITREENLKHDLGCNFISLSDHDSDGRNLAKIINHIHTYMQFWMREKLYKTIQ